MTHAVGRRPAGSGTREAITAAARRQFAELGYDRASIRSIAAEAGVDARLVTHYFGSKQQLFVSVVELPFDPTATFDAVFSGDPGAGRRMATYVISTLDAPAARAMMAGLVRAATSEPKAARLVRELLAERLVNALASHVRSDRPALRASLVQAEIVGLVMARNVLEMPAVERATPDELIELLAPVFELLVGEPAAPSSPEDENADRRT